MGNAKIIESFLICYELVSNAKMDVRNFQKSNKKWLRRVIFRTRFILLKLSYMAGIFLRFAEISALKMLSENHSTNV